MSYWKVTRPIARKDGSSAVQTEYVIADAAPEGDGVEQVPRLPGQFERWEKGAWVVDDAARAEADEEAVLRRLTTLALLRRAVRTAKLELIADLEAEGVLTAAVATKLKERTK